MANYSELIQTINDSIKANGNQEITGPVLNSVLQAMVSALGAGYQFMGIATPDTNPGTPDGKVFYIACTAGIYNNFGSASPYVMSKRKAVIFRTTPGGNWTVEDIMRNTFDDFISLPDLAPVLPRFSNSNRLLANADWFFRDMYCKNVRYKSITAVYADILKPGTFDIISAKTVDIYSQDPSLETTVLATVTADKFGWQLITLDTPISIDIYKQIGVRQRTAVLGYLSTTISGNRISELVSPYNNWTFNESNPRTLVCASFGFIFFDFTPMSFSKDAMYQCSYRLSKSFAESDFSLVQTGYVFYAKNALQAVVRGKKITHVYSLFKGPGTLFVYKAKNVETRISDETLVASINISQIGWQAYQLDRPLSIGNDEYLGFGVSNGDMVAYPAYYSLSETIYEVKSFSDGQFCFWSKGYLKDLFDLNIYPIAEGNIKSPCVSTGRSSLAGKKLSILGDSISTYAGFIPPGNKSFFPNGDVTHFSYTWWFKLLGLADMQLLVNQSWSGSRVSNVGESKDGTCMSNELRWGSLGTNDESPDVILFFGGINDVSKSPYTELGDYPTWGNKESMDRSTFRGAYAFTVQSILEKYPSSKLICMVPMQTRSRAIYTNAGSGWSLADARDSIMTICNQYGVDVIDMTKCGISFFGINMYTTDGTHPNKAGMELMANYVYDKLIDLV